MAQRKWPKTTCNCLTCAHSHLGLFVMLAVLWHKAGKYTKTNSVTWLDVLCVITQRGGYFNLQPCLFSVSRTEKKRMGCGSNSSLDQTPHLTLNRARQRRQTNTRIHTHTHMHVPIFNNNHSRMWFRHKNFKNTVCAGGGHRGKWIKRVCPKGKGKTVGLRFY